MRKKWIKIWVVRYEVNTVDGKGKMWFDRLFSSKKKAIVAVNAYKANGIPAYESFKVLE
jgi:hypothetical protein